MFGDGRRNTAKNNRFLKESKVERGKHMWMFILCFFDYTGMRIIKGKLGKRVSNKIECVSEAGTEKSGQ